jgi:hypothetical protein
VIVDSNQRWTEKRESRRPAGEVIVTSEYDVARIGPKVAKAFVKLHHYSGTCSSTSHCYGLYRHGTLVGAAVYGATCSTNAHRAVFGDVLDQKQAVTLGRLVLIDEVPGNGESWFVARTFRKLREAGVVAVESCADPQPRQSTDGRIVHHGHVGTVYSALNGRYVGKTNAASLWLLPNGVVYSNKASGKLARGEQGREYAGSVLTDWGADPLRDGEDPLAWLRYWRPRLTRTFRHHGNHRYLWCLDKRRAREVLDHKPDLAYPKLDLHHTITS